MKLHKKCIFEFCSGGDALKIGAGKQEINFPENFFPTEGFSRVAAPLYVRAAILCDTMEIAILSVELTSLPPEEISALKKIISEETNILEKNCWICVTHTFSAPHILPDAVLSTDEMYYKKEILKESLYRAVREAVCYAKEQLTEVQLKVGRSQCFVNVNRDFETPDGWWVSNCGEGFSDKTLHVISAEDASSKHKVIFVHYSVQSSVLEGSELLEGGKVVSGDLVGVMCTELEKEYPGAAAIFLLGAAGDQAPIYKAKTMTLTEEGKLIEKDAHDEGIGLCHSLGMKMAESAKEAVASAAINQKGNLTVASADFLIPTKKMNRNLHELKPTRFYEYDPEGEQEITIETIKIGNIALLGVKPELNSRTAQKILDQSPFETTLIMTMVNGGAKYMADMDSYDRFTYEAMNSPFARGAAEILCEQAVLLLHNTCS